MEANVNITGTASTFAGIKINDGTSSNSVGFGYYQNGRIQAAAFAAGSLVVNIDLPSFGLTSGSHFALAYKLNDIQDPPSSNKRAYFNEQLQTLTSL
jgi:hypothetical protein